MQAKIAVIGMGQGGMVAAIKLAEAGADVTIYERAQADAVSYAWRDDIRLDIFVKVGLPTPPDSIYVQKPNWVFVPPDWQGALAVPVLKPLEEVSISRRGLSEYFVRLATAAGVRCLYGQAVEHLWVEDERVVGVLVDGTPLRYDLVIDASGFMSPFRAEVPAKFGVQAAPADTDILVGHRAFYAHPAGVDTYDPAIRCTMSVRPLGWEGISWCNYGPDGDTDVLIARMGSLTEQDIEDMLTEFRRHHAILSEELLHSRTVPICLRKCIARPVADGYVALGDSAFMTIPVMGSGIEASMQGGAGFAAHVIGQASCDFSAASMWGFYVRYMHDLGRDFAMMDAIRRCALRWEPKIFNWAMAGKFLQYKELAYIMQAKGYGKPSLPLGAFLRTLFMLGFKPSVSFRLFGAVGHALRARSIAGRMPTCYDPQALARWQAAYDGHIAKLDAITARYGKKRAKSAT